MVKRKTKQNKAKIGEISDFDYERNSYVKTSFLTEKRGKIVLEINEIISLAWGAKEILRGDFKRIDYGRIILPFIVLRRLGRVLEETKKRCTKST